MTFEADVNTTSFQTIQFTNRSEEDYVITNLAFLQNDCFAFSVYNVEDEAGNKLYQAGDEFSIAVPTGITIDINIQFSPTPCEVTSYVSIFLIYYEDEENSMLDTINFIVTVSDNTPPSAQCETENIEYYDEFDNPTERILPTLPDGESYYLNIIQMNGYLQTTEEFLSFASQVSTHYNLDTIPVEEWYKPVYLSFTTDDAGNITIPEADVCLGFSLPTANSDSNFLGARVVITTTKEFTGTIDRIDDVGKMEIPNAQFKLSSFVNNSGSLTQDADGFFEINVDVSLTTTQTEYNSYLENLTDLTDDFGIEYFNISDGKLFGKNVRHAIVTLVGVGTFRDDEDVKMSNEARKAIVESESYLFIVLQGIITQVKK